MSEYDNERKQLETFRSQLLDAHSVIKKKADMLDRLKERGIGDIEGLDSFLKSKAEKEEGATHTELKKVEDEIKGDSEVKKLREEMGQMKELLFRQNDALSSQRTLSDVKELIKDKPEYALVSKMLNDRMALSIYKQVEADKQRGGDGGIEKILKATEAELRSVYGKMTGQEYKAGKTQRSAGEEVADSVSLPSTDTLPSFGDESEEKTNALADSKAVTEQRGRIDDREVFADFMKNNPIGG